MPPPAERAGLAIDACGVLNLAGAGVDSADLADALGVPLLVVEQVAAEALWIEDVVDGDVARVPVDLRGPVFAAVTRVSLAESELALYVALARELDDGESATLAVAQARRLAVLTDDRKARRVARGLALEVVGTAQILRQLTEHRGLAGPEVADMLQRVERRSRFRPRYDDPDADWWSRSAGRG